MPRQDPQGRWISDDGLQYWDGTTWRPTGVQAAAPRGSAVPAVLIGCGFIAVIAIVIVIVGVVVIVNNADFQRGFCNGYTNGNPNLTCPFNPPSP